MKRLLCGAAGGKLAERGSEPLSGRERDNAQVPRGWERNLLLHLSSPPPLLSCLLWTAFTAFKWLQLSGFTCLLLPGEGGVSTTWHQSSCVDGIRLGNNFLCFGVSR